MDSPWVVVLAVGLVLLVVVALAVWLRRRRTVQAPAVAAPRPAATSLRGGLLASRRRLAGQLEAILGRGGDAARVLPELEEALVSADVGVRVSGELIARVRARIGSGASPADVQRALKEEIEGALRGDAASPPATRPWVVLVTGVNGVGKTTTIGKLAALHAAAGRKVLLVAADTFRAAAIEQLSVWASRTGAEFVRQGPGANPAAVVFDGMKAALARGVDVVLVDTAGRLHTRSNLMDELRKVQRIVAREVPGAPHETLLVLDATTGQNALAQARTFGEAIGVTGIVLTKLDGTARGGVAIAVRREVGAPIRYVGVGEGVEDLRPFDAREFADALLDGDELASSAKARSA
jgi:fused signal recognition particle receptor